MRKLWYRIILLVMAYSLWVVPPASAHAVLVRSTPAANAVLAQPPVQVEIFFSEPLEPELSSIRVFDSENLSVDAGDVRVDPSNPARLTVSLHFLPDGVYTVTWKVVSSIDGHQTTGSFPFAVGATDAAQLTGVQPTTTFRLPFSTLVSKFLMLASLAVLLAHRLFSALVWDRAIRAIGQPVTRPPLWEALYHIGLIGLLIGIGLGMLAQGGQSTGRELAFPWDPEQGRILGETRLGVIWLARLALAMLVVWLAAREETLLRDWSSFAVNLALLFTVTLTSHAATEARPLLPILADWVHLIGMAFWLGGLVYLFTAIRHSRLMDAQRRTRLTSSLAGRFSVCASIFIGLIGLTGLYSAYLRLGSWSAWLTSLYGNALLVKQIFVAGLLVIAAINLLVISPRLRGSADTNTISRFGKLLILELTFAGLLLASVSFLTYIPPARIPSPATDLRDSAQVDDLDMELSIAPGRIGQNTFVLRLSSHGEALRSAREVLLRFISPQGDVPASDLELLAQGDGTFSAQSAHLAASGDWQVQAIVRREEHFDAYANFRFTLPEPGGRRHGLLRVTTQTGLLILFIGLLCGLLALLVPARPALRLGTGMPLAFLMAGLGIWLLVRPPPASIAPENPIPFSDESVAAGKLLFLTNCAPCHGPAGRGDGPVGVTLNPRPADLTQHAIPGIHTDAQLFEWITNGFPGSTMPAFKSTLSDTDRWHLVNFIRSLAPK
jgi:copper transport protein